MKDNVCVTLSTINPINTNLDCGERPAKRILSHSMVTGLVHETRWEMHVYRNTEARLRITVAVEKQYYCACVRASGTCVRWPGRVSVCMHLHECSLAY